MQNKPRSISQIAAEIQAKWQPRVHPWAQPYLSAMKSINTMDDTYGCEAASSIVSYFLGNAQSWRGEDARRIKKELNDMLKTARV